ncbi:uncharacterized protein LTR77_002890 [Saxophila tyrrhenica]|uniref:Uncharacterized protein n=1 Tax=Saxophila tyrrhenica TaxID=1690608 RepID=A0AAV9PKA7_9PEZI|nr:hypothetical protein LTR77_002890 [Saxophila tyrrhenica]
MRLTPCTALVAALLTNVLAQPTIEERAGKFTFYDMLTRAAGPCDLCTGPDGQIWSEDILVNKLFSINPETGKVRELAIPFTTPLSNETIPGVSQSIQDRTALSCAIRPRSDENLYAYNGLRNQLVRINPTTKQIKVLQGPVNPAGDLQPFNDITEAPGGMYVTQTSGNTFQYYDFSDESFTTYEVPTPASFPLGLKVASNGKLYVAELIGNRILEFDPETKAMKEFPLPLPLQGPAVVRAERNGYVYFSLFTGNGIGRINIETHKIDLYPSSTQGGLGAEDTLDSKGGVWLSYFTANVLARLDTNTFKYKYVPFPDTFARGGLSGILGDIPPYVDVAVHYGPGDAVWFASIIENKVGRYALS